MIPGVFHNNPSEETFSVHLSRYLSPILNVHALRSSGLLNAHEYTFFQVLSSSVAAPLLTGFTTSRIILSAMSFDEGLSDAYVLLISVSVSMLFLKLTLPITI